MPHLRKRHLSEPFAKLSAHSRIVGILGHRQVGKTTFLESHCREYRTLDESEELTAATNDPKGFLNSMVGNLSAIDECQLAPGLFPALKVRVQKKKTPGQFVLSGSVRFTSRKAIRESLTGRIANLELFPMVLSELAGEELPDFVPRILAASHFSEFVDSSRVTPSWVLARRKMVRQYLVQGGLPGICFTRDPATRARQLRDVLATILDRDLRLVYPTTIGYSQLLTLCKSLANRAMRPIHWADLARETGVTEKTLRKLLEALEAVFLVRGIPIDGGNRKIYFFEDQIEDFAFMQKSASFLAQYTGLIFRHVRAQFEYRLGYSPFYFNYRTRSNATVPLAIRQGDEVLGIYPMESTQNIPKAQLAHADSFLRTYARGKVIFVATEDEEVRLLDDRSCVLPLERLLFS